MVGSNRVELIRGHGLVPLRSLRQNHYAAGLTVTPSRSEQRLDVVFLFSRHKCDSIGMDLSQYEVHIKLRGEDLPIKDSWIQGGKADPYVVLRKGHGTVQIGKSSCVSACKLVEFKVPEPGEYMGDDNETNWVYNGKKYYQKNNLNPEWPTIVAPLRNLCDSCDITKPIVIDIWDYDFECPNDDFMGFCMMSIFDLFASCLRKCAIPLQPGKAGHTWSGRLFVDDIQLCPTDPKLDPINLNTLLHLMSAKGDLDKASFLIAFQSVSNPVLATTLKTKSTALHFAILGLGAPEGGNAEVVRILLEAKADVFAKSEEEYTPLDLLAKTADNTNVADMLIQKMLQIDSSSKVCRLSRISIYDRTGVAFNEAVPNLFACGAVFTFSRGIPNVSL